MPLEFHPLGVVYANGRFVTLADRYDFQNDTGSAVAYVSDDGIEWTLVEVPATRIGSRLAHGNGIFLGVADTGFLRSEDGITWEAVGPAPNDFYDGIVDFAAGQFISPTTVVGRALVGDGEEFTVVDVTGDPTFSIAALRAVNDAFRGTSMYMCCFGEVPEANRWTTLASDDGETWTRGEPLVTEPPEIVLDDGSVCLGFLRQQVMSGPTCDALHRALPLTFTPAVAVKAEGRYFVAGGAAGRGGVVVSSDGVTWTTVLSAELAP
jgi:hypothetical protein